MRHQRTTGIILRTYPLTETSLIVRWLTADFGRVSTVAKGARRSKSPFLGKLDLFYLAELNLVRSRSSELHILSEVVVVDTHEALRRELAYLHQAAYCAALIEQTTETDTPIPKMFQLFRGLLEHLPQQPPQPQTIFAFELKLLDELGLSPKLPRDSLSPGSRQIVERLLTADWPAARRLKPSEGQTTELRQFLHGFLIYHLGKFPEARARALNPGAK